MTVYRTDIRMLNPNEKDVNLDYHGQERRNHQTFMHEELITVKQMHWMNIYI